jgi:hypothetical protein
MAIRFRHTDHVAPSIRKIWQTLRRQAAVARGLRPWSLVLYIQISAEIVLRFKMEETGTTIFILKSYFYVICTKRPISTPFYV